MTDINELDELDVLKAEIAKVKNEWQCEYYYIQDLQSKLNNQKKN